MELNLRNIKSFSLALSLFYSCLAVSILMIQNFKRLFQLIGLPAPRSKSFFKLTTPVKWNLSFLAQPSHQSSKLESLKLATSIIRHIWCFLSPPLIPKPFVLYYSKCVSLCSQQLDIFLITGPSGPLSLTCPFASSINCH